LNPTTLIDKTETFIEDPSEGLIVKHSQYMPDDFISDLKRDKIDTLHTPAGDFHKVATIPVWLVEQWKREGFDIMRESARDTIARLKKHDMDALVTTSKRI
jgi:hypothetical protein